jgi:hypothetical protein
MICFRILIIFSSLHFCFRSPTWLVLGCEAQGPCRVCRLSNLMDFGFCFSGVTEQRENVVRELSRRFGVPL